MTTAQLIHCPPLDLPERVLRAAAQALLQTADGWQRWRQQRRAAQQAWLAEELGQALLQDIGAPAWLHEAAAVRRQAERQRMQALRANGVGGMFL